MPNYENFEIVVEKVGNVELYTVNVRQACGGKAGDASSSFRLAEITTTPSPAPPAAHNGVDVNDSQTPTRHIILSAGQPKTTRFCSQMRCPNKWRNKSVSNCRKPCSRIKF